MTRRWSHVRRERRDGAIAPGHGGVQERLQLESEFEGGIEDGLRAAEQCIGSKRWDGAVRDSRQLRDHRKVHAVHGLFAFGDDGHAAQAERDETLPRRFIGEHAA